MEKSNEVTYGGYLCHVFQVEVLCIPKPSAASNAFCPGDSHPLTKSATYSPDGLTVGNTFCGNHLSKKGCCPPEGPILHVCAGQDPH